MTPSADAHDPVRDCQAMKIRKASPEVTRALTPSVFITPPTPSLDSACGEAQHAESIQLVKPTELPKPKKLPQPKKVSKPKKPPKPKTLPKPKRVPKPKELPKPKRLLKPKKLPNPTGHTDSTDFSEPGELGKLPLAHPGYVAIVLFRSVSEDVEIRGNDLQMGLEVSGRSH